MVELGCHGYATDENGRVEQAFGLVISTLGYLFEACVISTKNVKLQTLPGDNLTYEYGKDNPLLAKRIARTESNAISVEVTEVFKAGTSCTICYPTRFYPC